MTDTVTIPSEKLQRMVNAIDMLIPTLGGLRDSGNRWLRKEIIESTDALRAALEQSVVKPDNLQCKSVQEPVHKLIYPGGGKALSNRLWHLTCNAVATQSGMRVRTDVMPMREMKEFLDHLCVLVDSPPQPAPVQEPQPVESAVKGAIMGAAYDFRDAHISGSTNLKRSAHAALEAAVDAALKPAPEQEIIGGLDDATRIGWAFWRIKDLEQLLASRPSYTAPQPAPVQSDGWLQDGSLLYRLTAEKRPQNRDEINVTMADGSRTAEARTRRAGELLDRIRQRPAPPADVPMLTDEELREAFAQSLTSTYVCGRVWSAWGYGTMSEDDFSPASECDELLDSLVQAVRQKACLK